MAAAHRLTMVGKKCENLHGHNWKIEAHVVGEDLDEGGVLMDFGEIKKHASEIMDTFDHKHLNEINEFSSHRPSSENIARYIAEDLQRRINTPGITVSRVSAWESNNSCATYIA